MLTRGVYRGVLTRVLLLFFRPASHFDPAADDDVTSSSRSSVVDRVALYETITRPKKSAAAATGVGAGVGGGATGDVETPYEDLAAVKRRSQLEAEHDRVWHGDRGSGGGGGGGDGGAGAVGRTRSLYVEAKSDAEPIYSKPDPKRRDASQSLRRRRSTTPPPGDQRGIEPTTPAVPPKPEQFSFSVDRRTDGAY